MEKHLDPHGAEWERLNDRRIELIQKDLDHTLNEPERAEYEELEKLASAMLASVAGYTKIDAETQAMIDEYLQAMS